MALDLLKTRRLKKGSQLPFLSSSENIRKRGLFVGGSLIGILFVSAIFTFLQGNFYQAKKNDLEVYARKYDQYVSEFNNKSIELSNTLKFNKKMAVAIGGLKSGSAILTEISRLIPAPLSLNSLTVKETSLRLRGNANQPNGVEHINLFLLNLEGSPFLLKDTVELVKVSESSSSGGSSKNDSSKSLKFTISANLSNDLSKVNRNYLQILGSTGLARRINLLKNEGLIK